MKVKVLITNTTLILHGGLYIRLFYLLIVSIFPCSFWLKILRFGILECTDHDYDKHFAREMGFNNFSATFLVLCHCSEI